MKILRLIYDWPPPWDGLAPHPYELTVAQLKLGHQIDIFCGRWPKAGPIESPVGVNVHPIIREPFPGAIFFTSSVFVFIKYLFWRKRNSCDVIHCHGHFAIWVYLYRKLLKKYFPWSKELKTPLIAHFHNTARGRWNSLVADGKQIKSVSRNFSWPLAEFSDKCAVAAASVCIFVNEETKNDAVKYYGADASRCFVVESGVNTDLFVPAGDEEREKARKELDLDMLDKVILNHGAMVDRKNIHLLVEALSFLPQNFKLLLVGPGDSAYQQVLSEKIKELKLDERVIRVGYTPYPQIPIAYQVADIFCLPSSWEGIPKVVMQGLACGLPCLVSGFKLSEEVRGLYYLENLEPQNIANKIQEIVARPRDVDTAKITIRHSWDKRVQDIDKIYAFAIKNYI